MGNPFLVVEPKEPVEPQPDIAECSSCGWQGPTAECETEMEGDGETGYYPIDLCPKCEDGGCVDHYHMTEERADEWNQWHYLTGEGLIKKSTMSYLSRRRRIEISVLFCAD